MKQLYPKLLFILLILTMSACTSLKPYERVFVNDAEMQMGMDAGKNFQQYIFSIREAAIPAGGARTSGGCGCN